TRSAPVCANTTLVTFPVRDTRTTSSMLCAQSSTRTMSLPNNTVRQLVRPICWSSVGGRGAIGERHGGCGIAGLPVQRLMGDGPAAAGPISGHRRLSPYSGNGAAQIGDTARVDGWSL